MNTLEKGQRLEREAEHMLQDEGFNTIRVVHTKWNRKDFFGLFDIIGINSWNIRAVQVKANRVRPEVRIALAQFARKSCPACVSVELWARKDRKGWVRTAFNRDLGFWQPVPTD